jgi:hypothetical protein
MTMPDEVLPLLLSNNRVIYLADKEYGALILFGTKTFKLWYDTDKYMIIVNRIPKTDVTLGQFTTFMYCLMSANDIIPLKSCWYDALNKRDYYLPESARRDPVPVVLTVDSFPSILALMNIHIEHTKASKPITKCKLYNASKIFIKSVMNYEDTTANNAKLHYCGGDGNDEFYCLETDKYYYGFELYRGPDF